MSETTLATDAEVSELRALVEKASPGPWTMSMSKHAAVTFMRDGARADVCTFYGAVEHDYDEYGDGADFANASFVAACRNLVPKLLTLLDSVRADAEKWRAQQKREEELCDAAERGGD